MPMYIVADTVKKNYIKVDTHSVNTLKTKQLPQVILTYGSLMQATRKEELNIGTFLSTRSNIAHILHHLQSGTLIYIW